MTRPIEDRNCTPYRQKKLIEITTNESLAKWEKYNVYKNYLQTHCT